ncbi:uncharacterized protein LOC143299184 [Babylonia areolata]|uniref:uncharacterized protein LOC143299184 n=1 Tax=Babylonia areolata TaxID=304850 RepID=UPI003FCFF852
MELKVAGRKYQRAAWRQTGDLKRVLDRRTKVKVSALLSPESQKAMVMVREESGQDRKKPQQQQEEPALTLAVREQSSSPESVSDDVSEADHVGFGALLERMCTARLHGDITAKQVAPRLSKKRALRSGDRLHTAMEVVEIVRHDCDDDDDHYDDTDDEQEAIERAAQLTSQQRCQAWLNLHFDPSPDVDDASSLSSADR